LQNCLRNELAVLFIQVNEYENVKYFNKERIELLVKWLLLNSVFGFKSDNEKITKKSFTESLKNSYNSFVKILEQISKSEYRVENLISFSKVKTDIKKTINKNKDNKKSCK
jgi:hypothetical protein